MTSAFNLLTPDWLKQAYKVDLRSVEDIAAEVGCSAANVRRRLKVWGILRGKVFITSKIKPVWNVGLTKETDSRLAKLSADRMGEGNPMHAAGAWNKGLSKDDDQRLMILSEKLAGVPKGVEHRQALSLAKRGLRGEDTNAFSGGKSMVNGYVTVLTGHKNGRSTYEYEHRLVVCQALGRALSTDEDVHHIDKVKVNNSPANLLLLSKLAHAALHSAMGAELWSKEIQTSWLKANEYEFEELK